MKEPSIEERENTVLVSLKHEPLASPEESLVTYLKVTADITNSKAREICHIGSESKMKKIFEKMIQSGVLESVPGKRGRAYAYRLTEKGRA